MGLLTERFWPVAGFHRFIVAQSDPTYVFWPDKWAHNRAFQKIYSKNSRAFWHVDAIEVTHVIANTFHCMEPHFESLRRAQTKHSEGPFFFKKKELFFLKSSLRRNFYAKLWRQQTLLIGFWRRDPSQRLAQYSAMRQCLCIKREKIQHTGGLRVSVGDCDLKSARNKRVRVFACVREQLVRVTPPSQASCTTDLIKI